MKTAGSVTGTISGTNLTKDLITNTINLWTHYDVRFNSGSNTSVDILVADGGGTHYFDDFNLSQIRFFILEVHLNELGITELEPCCY